MRLIDIVRTRLNLTPVPWLGSMRLRRDERTNYLADLGSNKSNRSAISSSQIEWEVVSIAFMHNLHAESGTIKNVSPGVHHMTLTRSNGLIEVESVEVECHRTDAEGGKPDPHDGECCEEKCSDRELLKEAYWKISRPK